MKKEIFCSNCGHKFAPVGREHICPSCKQAAAEDAKRAAVEHAKRKSWTGESVPVRISGRASTVIRRYSAENGLPFAAALDALLKSTAFFAELGTEWDTIEPYRSHRRDKHATETKDVPQDAQGEPVKPVKPVKQAAKITKKASASKAAANRK